MRLVALVMALVLTGCSFLFVQGPPSPLPPPPRSNIKCDRSADGLIAADILLGTAVGAVMLPLALLAGNYCHDGQGNCGDHSYVGPTLFALALTLPFYGSAYAGVSRARSCRKAQDAQ